MRMRIIQAGSRALLENFRPQGAVGGGESAAERGRRGARSLHIPVIAKRAGVRFDFSGATIEVVSPPVDYVEAKPGNNDSLGLRIAYGSRSFLLTGDMEKADGRSCPVRAAKRCAPMC